MSGPAAAPPKLAFISLMEGAAWGGSEELWSATAAEHLRRGGRAVVSTQLRNDPPEGLGSLMEAGAAWLPWTVPAQEGVAWRWMLRLALRGERFLPRLRLSLSRFRAVFEARPDVVCVSQGGTFDLLRHAELRSLLLAGPAPYAILCRGTAEASFLSEQDREEAGRIFGRAAFLGFASEAGIENTERHLGCRLPHACVVQSPIRIPDPGLMAAPDPGEVRLASVARLFALQKGQDLALKALSGDRWKRREWRLTFFGDGPDRVWLGRLTDYYGLTGRVTFAGHVPEIRDIWRSHHLLLLPSRTEGAPQALIQAMLCGRPAVATDVGGVREWVEESETGFLAPGCTPSALDGALERAWAMRDRWPAMGRRANAVAVGRRQSDPQVGLLGRLLALAHPRFHLSAGSVAPVPPRAL